jgi:hypothetical protein
MFVRSFNLPDAFAVLIVAPFVVHLPALLWRIASIASYRIIAAARWFS